MNKQAQIFDTFFYEPKKRDEWDVELPVRIDEPVDGHTVQYIAASPPDYRATFSGSGLPYGTVAQAYCGTPNKGTVAEAGGRVTIRLLTPNAYYDDCLLRVDPHALLRYRTQGALKIVDVRIGRGVPSRDIAYSPNRTGPEFYTHPSTVESQEALLRATAYPCLHILNPLTKS